MTFRALLYAFFFGALPGARLGFLRGRPGRFLLTRPPVVVVEEAAPGVGCHDPDGASEVVGEVS